MKIKGEGGSMSTGKLGKYYYSAYYKSLGVSVLKSCPERRKGLAFSEKQIANQSSFRAANLFAKNNRFSIIKPIWNLSPNVRLSGYNLFISRNKRAFNSNGEVGDFALLKASDGDLPLPFNMSAFVDSDEHSLCLSWENDFDSSYRYFRDILVIAVLTKRLSFHLIVTEAKRGDANAVIYFEDEIEKNNYIYPFFMSGDKKHFSDSIAVIL